jgi:hypothetical protein
MSNQKQYKRNSKSGDYQITGENSNGINISKDGNTYLFTGNNEEQLQGLRDGTLSTDNDLLQINDPNNAASFIGMYKTGGSNIDLGNQNQQSLNINNKPQDNQNVVTPVITATPTGSLPSKEPTPTPTPTPTVAPVIDTTIYEDIQELEFETLPDQEGFQVLVNIELEKYEAANEDEANKPALPTNETIAQILIRTGGSSGTGNEIPTVLGSQLNIIPGKVGASAYPGPPDFVNAGYKNGNLPTSVLIGVAKGGRDKYIYNGTKGWHLLHPEVARQYLAFKNFADSQNIKFTLSSAYRDIDHQRSLGTGSTVAKPGSSPHGWGGAIDISELYRSVPGKKGNPSNNAIARNTPLYRWFAANAPKFGFYNPYRLADNRGVDEVWHWEYWGFYVK